MFEGVQTCAPQKNPLILIWDERTIKRAQTVSEDPYRPERKLIFLILVVVFLPPLFKTSEGIVVGFKFFAWAPQLPKYLDSNKKNHLGPPPPPSPPKINLF
jgi:hypothetical protein